MTQQIARKEHLKINEEKEPSIKNKKKEIIQSYDQKWLENLEDKIKNNLHRNDFRLPELAYELNISERTLFNKVKEYTGLTPSLFLRRCRLEQAKHYIIDKKYETIKEVAYNSGFTNPRYFAIAFTKEFGKTPSEYFKNDPADI